MLRPMLLTVLGLGLDVAIRMIALISLIHDSH